VRAEFSIIILTFNEETHLPRLLDSVHGLNAKVYILDSGSTDGTMGIAEKYGAHLECHKFVNHPEQWAAALSTFTIDTPWIIGLDADHFLSKELYDQLKHFRDGDIPETVHGIYFNRKNYFKGKWIRHGGYFPKYMLKMFRTGHGASDLNEKLDHRFTVDGKTIVWKKGYLIEQNLKENDIAFWIAKHNRYSDLVAQDEHEKKTGVEEMKKGRLTGTPVQRIKAYKNFWSRLPLLVRPFLYFGYRYFIRLGFLDGKTGFTFHFLQAFWFRMLVDIKLIELKQRKKS